MLGMFISIIVIITLTEFRVVDVRYISIGEDAPSACSQIYAFAPTILNWAFSVADQQNDSANGISIANKKFKKK